jgi:YHS domain-containing protein
VIFRKDNGTAELGQCCCGRLLWLGDEAESRVRIAFEAGTEYELDRNPVTLPWGQTVEAVLAVPKEATHGMAGAGVDTVHDPVCHMDIDPKTAAATSEYKGVTYYFCARGCKLDFDDDPEGVLKAEAEFDHSQPSEHMTMASSAVPKKPWWRFWA